VRITAPSGIVPDESILLRARAEWLICSDECLPEAADLSVAVDVGETRAVQSSPSSAWTERLANLPSPAPDRNWRVDVGEASLRISWDMPEGSDPGDVIFFPLEQGVIKHAAPQSLRHDPENGGRALLTVDRDPVLLAKPDPLRGVLVSTAGWSLENGERRSTIAVEIDLKESRSGEGAGNGTVLLPGILVLAALVLLAVLKRPHISNRRTS
jgi:thiol:disulfide interchange protein DsbD